MLNKTLNDQSVKELDELLNKSTNIIATCHVRPDGDAIGSTLGWYHLLKSLNKHITVITPDQAPRSLTFLPGFKDVVPYTKYPDFTKRLLEEADLILCCDFNKLSRLDSLAQLIEESKATKVLIDHHESPDMFAHLTFSYPRMSSASELSFRLMAALGLYSDINLESATCICTGLITDTRNFSVNCGNPEVYSILLKLLDKGVDKQRIVKEALETFTLDSVLLHAYAISEKMEIIPECHSAIITLDTADLDHFNYQRGDTEGLVNKPLQIRGMISSFCLREDPDCVKISARSVNNFPVNRICEQLCGGGGHIMAAGGEFNGTAEECKARLKEILPHFNKEIKGKPEKIK
jgi:phosphoesterase RecJ-like protein